MTAYLCKIRLPSTSGLPRDDVDLDPVFGRIGDATSGQFDAFAGTIETFFGSTVGAMHTNIGDYLARDRDYNTNHASVDFYVIPAVVGPLGSPVATRHWTLVDPGSDTVNLPDQDACCLSFHGDLTGLSERVGTTRPRARRRGRLFFGPLNTKALEETAGATAPQTVNSDLQQDLGIAADAYLHVALNAEGWTWLVFSRVAWAGYPVVGGYVDDRFDTQRRRLAASTGRTPITWTP